MNTVFMLAMQDLRADAPLAEPKPATTLGGMEGLRVLQRLCTPTPKSGDGYGGRTYDMKERHLTEIVDALRKNGEGWDVVLPLTNAPEILRDIRHITGRFPHDKLKARRELMAGLSGFAEFRVKYLLDNGLFQPDPNRKERVGNALAALAALQDGKLSGTYSLILSGRQQSFFIHELELMFELELSDPTCQSRAEARDRLLARFAEQGWHTLAISDARALYKKMLTNGLPPYLVNAKRHDEEMQGHA